MRRLPVLTGILVAALALALAAGPVAADTIKVGMVTDMGGVDDKSFNQGSWEGIAQAIRELGIEGRYLESQQQSDYARNILEFIEQDYDLIVTVGFLLGDATLQYAQQFPDQKFAIVDYSYDPPVENIRDILFATDEAAFLAGYLAAGMTKTGAVGTFGGIALPTVTIFMDGFEAGVKYYNQVHGTSIAVLGWNGKTQQGLFAGNFESTDDGRRLAEALMDEGADIIMPVAGPVGLGAAAAAQERGAMIVGVDSDWYLTAPEFGDTILTSVVKKMDAAVYDAIEAVLDGTFTGGLYWGTLANGAVDIAPFHEYEDDVPASLRGELEQIRQLIINGDIDIDAILRS